MNKGSDFSPGLRAKFVKAFAAAGGTPMILNALAEGDVLLRNIILVWQGTHVIVPVNMVNNFTLDIDHSFTREQLREAIACDWVDGDFTEANVPLPTEDKKETVVVELLHLGYDISDDDATAEAKKRGYRRATPREVLTLGAKYPDLQRQFPIVAAPTGDGVLCLDGDGALRDLYVGHSEGDCSRICRFAVVREPDRIAEAQA